MPCEDKSGCLVLPPEPQYEKRYPYLDRDLIEFMCAIPREQLVRPGERRSLMRRSLVGIVPDEIRERKRKAYVARAPMLAIGEHRELLIKMSRDMLIGRLGIVDPHCLDEVLQKFRRGEELPIAPFIRALALESLAARLTRRIAVAEMPVKCPGPSLVALGNGPAAPAVKVSSAS